MPISTRHLDRRAATSPKLGADVSGGAKYRFAKEYFNCRPIAVADGAGGAATGVAADVNYILGGSGYPIEQYIIGTQTIIVPVLITTPQEGWNIGLDATDNDGWEYAFGPTIFQNLRGLSFKIGTDQAFYAKIKLAIADASGTDDFIFGFRKQEAAQGTSVVTYTDFAGIGCNAAAAAMAIKLRTQLNTAAPTNTDTTQTWADAAVKTLGVFVSAGGIVTYQINGAAPTVTAAFTFDDTDVVIPFIYLRYDTTTPGSVIAMGFECGLQSGGSGEDPAAL